MKKMKTILEAMALATVCALTLAGCARESMEKETGEVKFGFSATPTATRTEFQNPVTQHGTTSEQVRWLIGDVVTICSDKAAKLDGSTKVSQYEVSGYKSESEHDIASVENHGTGGGLRWADETSTHKFFAVYGAGASISMTGGVTGAAIPAEQELTWTTIDGNPVGKADMDHAYMVGVLETVYHSEVQLPMKQMYTAFQFTVGSGDNDAVALTSFTLSSTTAALAGGFTVAYPASPSVDNLAIVPTSTDLKSIKVDFPTDFQVVSGKPVTFTVLALAQPKETMTNLSITFTGPAIGTRTLELKQNSGAFIKFDPSTKNIINGLSFPNLLEATGEDIIWEQTAVGEPIEWQDDSYVLDHVNPVGLTYMGGESSSGEVISYKIVEGNPVAVPWTVLAYYDTEADAQAGVNPHSTPAASGWMTRYTTTAYPENDGMGVGSATGEPVRILYNESAVESETETIQPSQINAEIAANPFGLGSSPDCYFNLANPADMRSDYIVESANSYIINGPGYYRIPLVMGNGVKANKLNTRATTYTGFSSGGASSSAKLFRDYMDEPVVNPLLQNSSSSAGTPTSAFLVWEDAPGLVSQGLIEVASGNVIAAETGHSVITSTKSLNITEGDSEDNRVYWLNFHVAEGTQGNAVIAITDANSTVMWSYHFWVTNYVSRYGTKSQDLSMELNVNRQKFNGQANTVYKMMTLNLGWIYGGSNLKAIKYKENKLYAKIQQAESGKITIMEILRPGHHVVTKYDTGGSPYYQWGRKDPFMPSNQVIGGRYKTFVTNPIPTGSDHYSSFGYAIQNPWKFMLSAENSGTWFYFNESSSKYVSICSNAWSAETSSTVSSMVESGTGREPIRNATIYKTIYDPCPAGYSVPSYGASSFRTDDNTVGYTATYSTSSSSWTPPTTVAYSSKYNYGTATGSYYKTRTMDAFIHIFGIESGYFDENPEDFSGFNFYSISDVEYFTPTNYTYEVPKEINLSSPVIFYPTSGYRAYTSGGVRFRDVSLPSTVIQPSDGKRGYFWSALEQSDMQGCGFDFEHYWRTDGGNSRYFNVKNWSYFPMADGCAIRPMQNDN